MATVNGKSNGSRGNRVKGNGVNSSQKSLASAPATATLDQPEILEELQRLTEAFSNGQFTKRANPELFNMKDRETLEYVNVLIESLHEQLAWYRSIVDAVPFPIHVIDKNMNWTFLNKAFEKLMVDQKYVKNRDEAVGKPCCTANANICNTSECGIRRLQRGTGDSSFDWCGMSCKQDTSHVLNAKGEQVGFVEVVQDLTSTIRVKDYNSHEIDRLASSLVQLAKGDLSLDLKVGAGDEYTKENKAQFARINESLLQLKEMLSGLISAHEEMRRLHDLGMIDEILPVEKFQGAFAEMAKGINELVQSHIAVKMRVVDVVSKYAQGDLTGDMDRLPGKKALITEAVDNVKKNLLALNNEIMTLVDAAKSGKLTVRGDTSKFQFKFKEMVEGINSTLESIVVPLQEVTVTLVKLADGDLTAELTKSYQGDVNKLGQAVNALSANVRKAIQQIGRSVSLLVISAEEVNKVSLQLSASADQTAAQASVVSAASEQVSAHVQTVATGADEMGASIGEIAKNTSEATKVATAAVRSAEATNKTISKLGQSSAEIGQVIKVITSIAQQTNLLALNATIEAARAGEAGKGFAVVANEVKELAKETAKATEDISRKIEAIQADTKGAVSAIGQIGGVIAQISDIQTTIASAVEEQSATTSEISRNLAEAAQGASDITKNIAGVAEAAKSTTAGAIDTQKSAQSLERMAAELQGLVSQFKC